MTMYTHGGNSLGVSGRIARYFMSARITPLLALVALLLGAFAVVVTPREEEPQINVTMANVLIPFPGASARDVEQMVAAPAEQVISQIADVEHVTSVTRPGMAVLTVQYKVGVPRTEALVRLYDTILSNQDWLPSNLGTLQPIVKPKGIDDVPIVALTLYAKDATTGTADLERVAHAIEVDLKRVTGTRDVRTIGGPKRALNVKLDPARMASTGVTVTEIRNALQSANSARRLAKSSSAIAQRWWRRARTFATPANWVASSLPRAMARLCSWSRSRRSRMVRRLPTSMSGMEWPARMRANTQPLHLRSPRSPARTPCRLPMR